jgi:hypothetical protein
MPEEDHPMGDAAYLKRQAERCARLAATATDRRTSELLQIMAGEFQQLADYVSAGGSAAPGER